LPIDKEWVLNKMNAIIYNRFGTNIGPGEPRLITEISDDKEKQYWLVPLEVDYPRIIEDRMTGTRRYIVFHLGKLSEVKFDADQGKPLELPERTLLSAIVKRELMQIRERVEKLMVRTASYNLAKLVSLKHMMSPLSNLITSSLRREAYVLPDMASMRRQHIQKYVDLLVDRKFVVHEKDVIEPSPTLWELFQARNDYSYAIECVLKDIIENAYEILYDKYNIRVLHPYIEISSSYYDYALSAQELVALSTEDLWEAYSGLYMAFSERRRFRFDDYLRELSQQDVDILEETEKGAWKGNKTIFDKMRQDFPIQGQTGIITV